MVEDIVNLSKKLIEYPSVSVGETVRLDDIKKTGGFISRWLKDAGLEVRTFNGGDYPAVLAAFPDAVDARIMLSGHFDVVAPEPDESQFAPKVDGDYLWGRGAADMKTVVATYMVWMRETLKAGAPYPDINLLLVGNEETGEGDPMGTGHVLKKLAAEDYAPEILIAGERTEETGHETWGEICVQNRGVARFRVTTRGMRAHPGMSPASLDLTQKLIRARTYLNAIAERYLNVNGKNSWRSQIRFPFVQVGTPGVYNITPDYGTLGVEIRAIPGDRLDEMLGEFGDYAHAEALEISDMVMEPGSACDVNQPDLLALMAAVREESGEEPRLGKKMAGTSARFAPNGNGVVWGQSGIGPHSADERHFIPSIDPYYRTLVRFGELSKRSL